MNGRELVSRTEDLEWKRYGSKTEGHDWRDIVSRAVGHAWERYGSTDRRGIVS